MTQKKKIIGLCILIVLALCIIGVLIWLFSKPSDAADPKPTNPTVNTDPVSPSVPNNNTDSTTPAENTGTETPTMPPLSTDPTDGTSVPGDQQTGSSGEQSSSPDPTIQPDGSGGSSSPSTPSQTPSQPSGSSGSTSQPSTPPATENKDPRPEITSVVTKDHYLWVGDAPSQLKYTYSGDPKDLTWYSRDPDIASVDQNGVVTPVSEGYTYIIVYAGAEETSKTRGICSVNVGNPKDRTTHIDYSTTNPLFNGVTKHVGNELEFSIHTYCEKADGSSNNKTDVFRISSFQTSPGKITATYPPRNVAITSSNTKVVSVVNEYKNGFYTDFLRFKSAGTAVITITSWDGYSESFTINVKNEYDCYPGKTKLTPGEFAYYATMVGMEDGLGPVYRLRTYLYIWYSDDELTWERAKSLGHGNAQREYQLGKKVGAVVYAGWDSEVGKHLFYHGTGEPASSIDRYKPASGSNTGNIRFASSSLTMTEHTGKLYEVLGNVSSGYVTYTSSNPDILMVDGGFFLAQGEGTVTVTATYKGQVATLTVTVKRDPNIQRLRLDEENVSLWIWKVSGLKLGYTYFYHGDLTWTSSDPAVASVTQDGYIYPGKVGQCVITVTDGVNTDSCVVTVYD